MKVTLTGSHLCQDTLYALIKLKSVGAQVDFEDISSSFPALKSFLELREHEPMYDEVKANGGIGIPFMSFDDGYKTFDIRAAIAHLDSEV